MEVTRDINNIIVELYEGVENLDSYAQFEIFPDELKRAVGIATKIKNNSSMFTYDDINYYNIIIQNWIEQFTKNNI